MSSYIEKNITELVSVLQKGMIASLYVSKRGLLQSLDPRTKVAGSLLLIILASSNPSIYFLLILYGFCIMLAQLSGIPLRIILRVWIVLPFFSLFLALPLIFSFVTQGSTVLSLPWFFHSTITKEGIILAVRLLLRITTTITLVQLVLNSTRWDHILKAMRIFRIPDSILFVFALTYRYIFILLTISLDMIFARKSRNVGRVAVGGFQSWIGNLVGILTVKSFAMSTLVHEAMKSRGFTGRVRTLQNSTMRCRDYMSLFVLGILLYVSLTVQ